jgi:GTP cyclohydrolase I
LYSGAFHLARRFQHPGTVSCTMAIERLPDAALVAPPVDAARMERAVREIIEAIGEDPERQGLLDTPARVARMYAELFEGLRIDPREYLSVRFDVDQDEMVILKDIPFYSVCEHHFMPFHGIAAVGYLPDGRVVGLSKLARLVDGYARRPQLQERLTGQIADAIVDALHPDGVAVVIEAEHLCMTARGVRKPGSRMMTSATRGAFRNNSVTRAEFLSLVRGS